MSLKNSRVGGPLTFLCIWFHSVAAVTTKTTGPANVMRVILSWGTAPVDGTWVGLSCVQVHIWREPSRYMGARLWTIIKIVITSTFNWIQKQTSSKYRCFKIDIMWSHSLALDNNQYDAFWISCSFWIAFKSFQTGYFTVIQISC